MVDPPYLGDMHSIYVKLIYDYQRDRLGGIRLKIL